MRNLFYYCRQVPWDQIEESLLYYFRHFKNEAEIANMTWNIKPEELMTPLRNARMKGERRSLRVPVRETSIEEGEEVSLIVSFSLPRGSYATIVLREIMKAGDDAVVMESDTTT